MAMELFKNFERIPHSFGFSNHYLASAIALLNSFFFLQPTLDITTRSILRISTMKQMKEEIKWCDNHLEKPQAKFIDN